MSRINDLIQELCPNGVVYKPLNNLLNYEQPTKYIVNATDYDSTPGVPVLTPGQTFILGYTKETDGIYQADKTNPTIIFDDFTTAFKWVDFPFKVKSSAMKMLSSRGEISLRFAWYAMQTIRYNPQNHARQWIKNYSAFEIPVPPMPVQNEIVGILDSFTSLEAELEAELASRREQYNYYRDISMTFDLHSTSFMTLGDLGTVFGGLTGKSKADFGNVGEPYVTYSNVYSNKATDITAHSYVQIDPAEHQNRLQQGDILLTSSSETPDEVALSSVITKPVNKPLYLNSFTIGVRPKHPFLDLDFAKHLFRSAPMRRQLIRTASGVTRFNVSKSRLAKVMIPIPDRKIQENIAAELDKFDVLANSLYSGLPAEIEARHKQYEYYRNRLLTFKELDHE